jgi:hypothetical protein
MKRPVSLAVVSLFVGMSAVTGLTLAGSQDRGLNEGDRDRFMGAWLAWLEEQGADGKLHRVQCEGMLVFTRDGHMSVQVMARDPQPEPTAGPVQYTLGGYEASYGRYDIDERSHRFTYHVEGALVRTLISQDLTRLYDLAGKQLIVKSSREDEHWRVAWEHYWALSEPSPSATFSVTLSA